ncbi:hypothetical protein AC579_1905 [Pseudocercospora musae]|uniref:Uncharacterized protein n=1 Tax=Pseudocercospora musae TaxID=113226 RepID=A0A139I042_9PEZI|nr:hypothetical protein AC579_1905 [Pseudocercospora musae]
MWRLRNHHGTNYGPVQEEPTANYRSDQDLDCPWKTSERQWYSRGIVVLCIILLSNALTASVSYLLLRCEQVSAAFVCAGDVQPATQWMSGVDQSLHSSKFLPWIASPTQYSADTADLGDSVDDAWKDLGVYCKSLNANPFDMNHYLMTGLQISSFFSLRNTQMHTMFQLESTGSLLQRIIRMRHTRVFLSTLKLFTMSVITT